MNRFPPIPGKRETNLMICDFIFFDYAGIKEGKYRGALPALLLIRKELKHNEILYTARRKPSDAGMPWDFDSFAKEIFEDRIDRQYGLVRKKDEFGNLVMYSAYALKIPPSSLSYMSGAIVPPSGPDITKPFK